MDNTTCLGSLARLYGIQTAYYDVNHRRQTADPEALLLMLRALGAPVTDSRDIPAALREKRQAIWQQLTEPVHVAWDGRLNYITIRLPAGLANFPLAATLRLESGETRHYEWRDLAVVNTAEIERNKHVEKRLLLPEQLPIGYHHLNVEAGQKHAASLIIAAPTKAYDTEEVERRWGVFLPLYALRTRNSLGSGDFADLAALSKWAGQKGAGAVATLPLLPTFAGTGADPSPYNPISRRLWNEYYISIDAIPELANCSAAQQILNSSQFCKEAVALREAKLVDYPRIANLKRRLLEELCRHFFNHTNHRREEFQKFLTANPMITDYALFRAAGEKSGTSWRAWPQPLRDGTIHECDFDESSRRYHEYTQWLAQEQMAAAAEQARRSGVSLYLDLPQGAHPDGYDVWRNRNVFLQGATAGAPPDTVFTRGQDWAFLPLHPHKLREQGYDYTIACLRHHLKYAGILRIDHMMGFHRLFCIPQGMSPDKGVYLRYPAEELYAILTLESCRHRAIIVGEDLGMVPSYVRPTMKRHGLNRMYILHYELAGRPQKRPPPIPRNTAASLNTHDMPPFAALWDGSEIAERRKLGLLDAKDTATEQKRLVIIKAALTDYLHRHGWLNERSDNTRDILKACLYFLSASPARLVLVNLEDMWGEKRPQNVPGIGREKYPSWRRRSRYSLEEFCRMPEVNEVLQELNGLRSGNISGKVIR
ncbi:MAG: 4-alpha-glucanotransferase [Dehalococcoidales bacterium]|nr:4-alpha-glucanotransferase [Dehalococcoidales bacterium]